MIIYLPQSVHHVLTGSSKIIVYIKVPKSVMAAIGGGRCIFLDGDSWSLQEGTETIPIPHKYISDCIQQLGFP